MGGGEEDTFPGLEFAAHDASSWTARSQDLTKKIQNEIEQHVNLEVPTQRLKV